MTDFVDDSALLNPRALPLNLKQVSGHPMMITESHWVPPLGYQSEGPFLVSTFQSLTGVDAFYWFSTGEAEWSNIDRAEWDSASRAKWSIATPMILAQFPAAALLFRKGYLKQGEPVIVEHRTLKSLWERKMPVISEDPSYDPNRDLGDSARRSNLKGGADPLAFLVGPVKVVYDEKPAAASKMIDLKRYVDHKKKTVHSVTSQVAWNYGTGLCTIDAPQAQGASGFLKRASPIKLKDLTIQSSNDYATIMVVSLDGLPLATSKRVLAQVGTLARPTGWVERETTFQGDGKETYTGKEIIDTGKMPWAIVETAVTLTLANPSLKTATELDLNGNAHRKLKPAAQGPIAPASFAQRCHVRRAVQAR